jgi:polysaccharide pyruvyl transferase WcaK-like protein
MSDIHRPKQIVTFLIWGGWYGSRNIGDTAILLGLRELINKVNPKQHFYIQALSTDIDYTCTNGVTGKRALIKSDIFRIWPWFQIVKTFEKADRIIISGGTPIFDFSHGVRTIYFFLPILLQKPFWFFGIGAKPIQNWYGKKYIPFIFNKAKGISIRDEGSKHVLTDLGITENRINLTADSALFAPPADDCQVADLLQCYGIHDAERILVVAPRLLSQERKRLYLEENMDKKVIEETPKKIAASLDQVSQKFDKIVFLAMHYYGPDSDVPIINNILQFMRSKNVVYLNEEVRPLIAIGIFKKAILVFGMRLHSLLLAASMGTPVVGIAYEKKVKDLLSRIQLPEYCLDLFSFSQDSLTATLKKAISQNQHIRNCLNQRIRELRNLIMKEALRTFRINP